MVLALCLSLQSKQRGRSCDPLRRWQLQVVDELELVPLAGEFRYSGFAKLGSSEANTFASAMHHILVWGSESDSKPMLQTVLLTCIAWRSHEEPGAVIWYSPSAHRVLARMALF